MIVMLYPGASDTLTLRGITVPSTVSPKWRRTSAATWSASLVRPSYMVSTTVLTDRRGLRWARTISMFFISWDTPSSA